MVQLMNEKVQQEQNQLFEEGIRSLLHFHPPF